MQGIYTKIINIKNLIRNKIYAQNDPQKQTYDIKAEITIIVN